MITETWLRNNILDEVVAVHNYSILRQDRQHKKGGGVCVFVEKSLSVNKIPNLTQNLEFEMLCFAFSKHIFIILYIPPNLSKVSENLVLQNIVEQLDFCLINNPNSRPIVCGDLNDFPVNKICKAFNIKNIVCSPTRQNALLDYFLVPKCEIDDFTCIVKDPLANSDHNTVHVFQTKPKVKKQHKYLFDLRAEYLCSFRNKLHMTDWSKVYQAKTVDEKIDSFYNNFKKCTSVIPKRKVVLKDTDLPWVTPVIKSLICKRYEAYKKKNFPLYHHFKEKIKIEIQKSKKIWADGICLKDKNPWKLVKLSKRKPNIDNYIESNFNSKMHFANEMNVKFHSVFQNEFLFPNIQFEAEIDEVSVEDTKVFLETLNKKKSYADEGFPIKLLQICSDIICYPLSHIITSCLQQGTFPQLWKLNDVVPLPKSKHISIDNFRPISLRPVLSTLLEREILKRIKPYIIPQIDNTQFGFRSASSTQIALIKLLELTTKFLEQKTITATSIVSFDLKKAFDTVPHEILYKKLCSILPLRYLSLITSYLSNRNQRVVISQHKSDNLRVTSGVPQGSMLSPILFLYFISDLTSFNDNYVIKFADDTSFVIPHFANSLSDPVTNVILYMEQWCNKNGIQLNLQKTQILTVHQSTSLIKQTTSSQFFTHSRSDTIKILGVKISKNLKWDNHIDEIYKKSAQRLYILRKMKPILSKTNLIKLYYGLIDSLMCYCSSLFVNLPLYLNNKLTSIHKRAVNIIFGKDNTDKILVSPKNYFSRLKNLIISLIATYHQK